MAKDLAHYYLTSEQIPTSFSLSIKFDTEGKVAAAGGMFLQAMPDADDAMIREIEKRVVSLPSIGELLAEGTAPSDIVLTGFGDFAPRLIDQREVGFVCHCNRDEIRNILLMLPIDELKDLQAEGPFPVEIRCHHCNARYAFDREQIDLIAAARFADN
jgi:molecular chaperone Hsp33